MTSPSVPLLDRLVRNVQPTPEGCWLWMAAKTSAGYGQVCYGGRTLLAHRAAFEEFVGPIPVGLYLDHLCRTPSCINPTHLEPVTPSENSRRGRTGAHNSEKTHCPQGHEYVEANIYWVGEPRRRQCKTCTKARTAERHRRARLAA